MELSQKVDFELRWWWVPPLLVTSLWTAVAVGYVYVTSIERNTLPWEFKILLVIAILMSAAWFVRCFTGDPDLHRAQQFIFAYFFVIVSFSFLSIPPFIRSQAIGTEPIGIVSGCVRQTTAKELLCFPPRPPDSIASAKSESQEPTNQWLVNIGGTLSQQEAQVCKQPDTCPPLGSPEKRAFVDGGIVVPLGFVIFALFGGAISLSRRVPEIQKRSEAGYVGTPTEPKLQAGEVREMLAFQILQFISAPLIAITAYQVIHPDTDASSAALAFMSGFGSETILLMIRGIANGIRPQSVTPAATGIVGGVVTDQGQPQADIDVVVVGSGLKTKTDKDGKYALREVPVGGRAVYASGTSVSGSDSITVQAGQTVTCNIALKRCGAISGIVKRAGEAAPNLSIFVALDPANKANTDKDGRYVLQQVTLGEQTVTAESVSGAAKLTGSKTVVVEFNKTATCDIDVTSY
jgi:hypothetical protein